MKNHVANYSSNKKIARIGIGGPVGSGKTAIIEVITPILIKRGSSLLLSPTTL